VTAVLAELFVKELISDADAPCCRVWGDMLELQLTGWQVGQRVARSVLAGGVIKYEWTRTEKHLHHEWSGERSGVEIRVVALGPPDELPLDPLDAADEDDYLERLIRIGLVVE
jgi:hypothetical protein